MWGGEGERMEKILLYKSKSCTRCPIAKFILSRVLTSKGLSYHDVVVERDTESDPEAMAALLMLDAMQTPVLKAGKSVVREEDALKEGIVRDAVEDWMASNA
jgi:glutaredoxin